MNKVVEDLELEMVRAARLREAADRNFAPKPRWEARLDLVTE